jgi:hypothetical protein
MLDAPIVRTINTGGVGRRPRQRGQKTLALDRLDPIPQHAHGFTVAAFNDACSASLLAGTSLTSSAQSNARACPESAADSGNVHEPDAEALDPRKNGTLLASGNPTCQVVNAPDR